MVIPFARRSDDLLSVDNREHEPSVNNDSGIERSSPDTTTPPVYVEDVSWRYRRPPIRFRIEPSPEYCNADGQLVCSPGSTFGGAVHLQLSAPLAALRLKLVFKATEQLFYDAMGWGKRIEEDAVFAIRTNLWGAPSDAVMSRRTWPVLEAGYHTFPFVCEMPLVNYPPSSCRSSLVCHDFSLTASLERPGDRPFQTEPCPVFFQPIIIPFCPDIHRRQPYNQQKPLGPWQVRVVVPQLAFNVLEAPEVKAKVYVEGGGSIDSHSASNKMIVSMSLEQHIKVTTSGFYHDTIHVVAQVEEKRTATGGNDDVVELRLPLDKQNSPSVDYLSRLQLQYMLRIVVKLKLGPLYTKKRPFLIPVSLGTASAADSGFAPTGILPYTHPNVAQDTTFHTKPKFLRLPEPVETLPPYDSNQPPDYSDE